MRTIKRLSPLFIAAVLTTACEGRPPEYGVNVFSADTIPVVFTLQVTGSLGLAMRSDGFKMRPDKSLVLSTPAQLTVARGDGTARIESIRGGRLAIQPLGISADSADTATVEGLVVMLVKPPNRRIVKLTPEKP